MAGVMVKRRVNLLQKGKISPMFNKLLRGAWGLARQTEQPHSQGKCALSQKGCWTNG